MRTLFILAAAAASFAPATAHAFCGFFVGAADASLYNSASQVVIVHDEGRTVLTMMNDYRGEPRAFALVVPVPVVLQADDVRIADPQPIAHLDTFTAPRLVEYFDEDPCRRPRFGDGFLASNMMMLSDNIGGGRSPPALGVKIEAAFTVGEYDIEILSAEQSDGLETYLRERKYNIPRGASAALAPYIATGTKFFVAKVNLEKHRELDRAKLSPLQFGFADPRFMLPVRLGMLNADGPQELLVYAITKQYRVEATNYRTKRLPSGNEIPVLVKEDFARFYRDLFSHQVELEHGGAVFTEHAWDMSWCDPCSSEPLSKEELEKLGVWWLGDQQHQRVQAFVTRLHARYTPATFPEDLMLKVTRDAQNFQTRFVLRHEFKGLARCAEGARYRAALAARDRSQARELAALTGWPFAELEKRLPDRRPESIAPLLEDPALRLRARELMWVAP